MFDGGVSRSLMTSSVYPIHMNCQYNHSLNDDQLVSTVDSLLSRNLIQQTGNSIGSDNPVLTLTEAGGEQWELERQPDWDRFLTISHKQLGCFPTGSIRVLCHDAEIGLKCFGAMFASGTITPTSPIRCRELYGVHLVPWKSFPMVFALRCRTSDSIHHLPKRSSLPDVDVYEAIRCWWQSLDELRNPTWKTR